MDDYLLSDLSGNTFRINEKPIFDQPFVAGDTWNFQYRNEDYVNNGYTASITIAADTVKIVSQAIIDNGWYKWSISGSQTQVQSQPYLYNIFVTGPTGDRITVERGALIVASDISIPGTNVSNYTNLQLMLKVCDDTLINLLSQKTTMVQFAGQTYQFHDIEKLFKVRNELYMRVSNEQELLQGNARSRKIVTVFVTM